MQGLEPFATVVGAPRRLAIDGDEVVLARPQRGNPAIEAVAEQHWIDAIEHAAQAAPAAEAAIARRGCRNGTPRSRAENRDDPRPSRRCRRSRRRKRWWRTLPIAAPLRA